MSKMTSLEIIYYSVVNLELTGNRIHLVLWKTKLNIDGGSIQSCYYQIKQNFIQDE